MRIDKRSYGEIRPVSFEPNYVLHSEGSVLVSFGLTKIICTASVENTLPKWLQGSGKGWVTAEYSMLPRSTHTRIHRDKATNSGRSQEISRLISRSLRAVTDLKKLGERQVIIDCDVLQADGGTRTAAITGGFVAMALAFHQLKQQNIIKEIPLTNYVSAVSVGVKEGTCLVDLCYEEDVSIETDMNFVATSDQRLIEVQGTAEAEPFTKKELDQMYDLAAAACAVLFKKQSEVIGHFYPLKA
ncbi:MAG: ribonuclease PH [Bdellovibrionales bacterium]|nr:ribonuclease PH [Bdellovibrionales bacterium]